MQKAKTSSYAHISSTVTVGQCPRVKMSSPDRRLGVLLDKLSRVVCRLEYKCLPDNYFAIFQTFVASLLYESTNAHNLIKNISNITTNQNCVHSLIPVVMVALFLHRMEVVKVLVALIHALLHCLLHLDHASQLCYIVLCAQCQAVLCVSARFSQRTVS